MIARLLPLFAVLITATSAGAHTIGIDHSHTALDSSLIVGAVLAVAAIGLAWAKSRD